MRQIASISPANSIIVVADGQDGKVPEIDDLSRPAWATSSCIIVRCRPDVDGPTEIVLGDRAEVDPGLPASFTSALRTPRRAVQLTEVGGELVLELPVATDITRVTIWVSHPEWPEQVIVGVG